MSDADLSQFGLARCRRCRRILLTAHIDRGRCKPGKDCGAHAMIVQAVEDGHLDSIAFARAVERGLLADGLSLLGMSEPAEEEVGILLSVPAGLLESPSEALHGLPDGTGQGKDAQALHVLSDRLHEAISRPREPPLSMRKQDTEALHPALLPGLSLDGDAGV